MRANPLGQQPHAAAGIHSLDHFALAVPDLQEAERFLIAFGLSVRRRADELELRTEGNDHLWGRIFQGPKKRLEYICVGCYAEDLDRLRKQVVAAGGALVPAHARGSTGGFWFTDIDGNLMQVRAAGKTMPDSKAPLVDENVPSGERGAPPRSAAPEPKPVRLCHLALFTPNLSRVIEFHQKALGLLLADRSRDIIGFMYGRHGSDHHLLAFLSSGGAGLHHSSWDVLGIGAIGLGAERMRDAGYAHQWGLGRHVLGSNYFNYVHDVWGTWWEHICHIDYIPKDVRWDGGDYDAEDGFYLWGPSPPADFGSNTEI